MLEMFEKLGRRAWLSVREGVEIDGNKFRGVVDRTEKQIP